MKGGQIRRGDKGPRGEIFRRSSVLLLVPSSSVYSVNSARFVTRFEKDS